MSKRTSSSTTSRSEPRVVIDGDDLVESFSREVYPADPEIGVRAESPEIVYQITWPDCILHIPARSPSLDREAIKPALKRRVAPRPEGIDSLVRTFTVLCEVPDVEELEQASMRGYPIRLPKERGRRRSYPPKILLWARRHLGVLSMYLPRPKTPVEWAVAMPPKTTGVLFLRSR